MREDDPLFYRSKLQQLIKRACKNGISTNYLLCEDSKEKTLKIIFKDMSSGNYVATKIMGFGGTEKTHRNHK